MHADRDIRWSWDARGPGHPVGLGCALARDAAAAGCGIPGRVRSARSIPLRSISLTGFALYKKRIRKFLMCKHNGISCFSFCALLIAYVDIIPHFPVNSYA